MPLNPNPYFGVGATGTPERRQSVRKPLRTAATLDIAGQHLPARMVDISRQGLSVTAERNLPPGTECEVAFVLLDGGRSQQLRLRARVVHGVLSGQDGFKIGLMLATPTSNDQQVIDRYLKS